VRVSVAGQELADAQRIGRVTRSDRDDITEPLRDDVGTAQDECAHQDLAELGVGLDEGHQPVAVHFEKLARFAHLDVRDAGTARQQVDLAGELPALRVVITRSVNACRLVISSWPAMTRNIRSMRSPIRTSTSPRETSRSCPCGRSRPI
jgi:hypothetical protein